MIVAGCGALNLDIIYEIESMEPISQAGFPLEAGRECVLDHSQARELLDFLNSSATLIGKSGGGSAANTICALAKMGHRCYFLGTVGEDEEGEFLTNSMTGVDCSLVTRFGKSSMCIIVIDRINNDRALAVVPGDFALDPDHPKIRMLLENTRILHISSLAHEEGPRVQEGLTGTTGENCLVSFDPGEIYAQRGLDDISGILDKTGLLFASDVEFASIFQGKSVMEVLSQKLFGAHAPERPLGDLPFFQQMASPVLAKKSGSKGALLASRNNVIHCPAKKVESVKDNTGAGDAFNAGLLNAISQGKGAEKALKEAVSLAAFSLGFAGRQWIEHLNQKTISH
ncbi:MAG: hypothetical protein GXO58_06660 [Thermodesulfobacteria bacterium]|nr:hypothetical protein [Thermodesulfobacteriota bacterium]